MVPAPTKKGQDSLRVHKALLLHSFGTDPLLILAFCSIYMATCLTSALSFVSGG